MQRYRVVILVVVLGVLPVAAAFFIALSFLEKRELEQSPQVETARVAEEPPPPEQPEQPESPPETLEVLAAARSLPAGTLLDGDDLAVVSIEADAGDEDFAVEDFFVDTEPSDLHGHVMREALAPGAPLTRPSVLAPGQPGFLAATLRSGTRAVNVRVGQAASHAGLVDLGDRVDVILSAELAAGGVERGMLARTIVEDARVIAIDGRMSDRGSDEITTVTLETSPAQAGRLVLADREGLLSLVVRPLATARSGSNADTGEAVDLREMLLSSPELSVSEARRRRERELDDLSLRKQIAESREQLRAMLETRTVRVFRGSEPAEEVVLDRRRARPSPSSGHSP